MSQAKIILMPQELIKKLQEDIEKVLELRDENHYRNGRPDEEDDDVYLAGAGANDAAWERWANATYEANNRMGGYLADAQKLIAAISRYIDRVEGESEESSNE